jgi:hypothetical protein
MIDLSTLLWGFRSVLGARCTRSPVLLLFLRALLGRILFFGLAALGRSSRSRHTPGGGSIGSLEGFGHQRVAGLVSALAGRLGRAKAGCGGGPGVVLRLVGCQYRCTEKASKGAPLREHVRRWYGAAVTGVIGVPGGQRRTTEDNGGQRRTTEDNGGQRRTTEDNGGQRRTTEDNTRVLDVTSVGGTG